MVLDSQSNLWLVPPMADHRDTLLLPFEKGLLNSPGPSRDWGFLNACLLPETEGNWHKRLICEQGYRGEFLALQQSGISVAPSLALDKNFSGMLVLASRSRTLNEENLARAWNAITIGSVIVFAGRKNSGVQPIRKWAGQRAEIAGSLSKHHAIVFWLIRDDTDWPLPPIPKAKDGFLIAPGMFSAEGPDKGSMLLAQQFGDHIRGKVADFGAGWGYLSSQLLAKSAHVESLDLFEADWKSLEASKQNVGPTAEYHWADLTIEAPRGLYNWIIMNPPFHTGRAAEPKLGTSFIEAAAKALPSGGHLLMVANTNLPYEKVLAGLFKKVERKAQADGFKVIEAVR